MEGPFGFLVLAIQERLKDLVPEIREVAEDKGQLDFYDIKPPVAFPCILVDFDGKFDDMGENTQMGDIGVILRLGWPPYTSSSSLLPQALREKGLAYFDIELKVFQAINGWKPVSDPATDGFAFGYLMRRSATTEKRNDPLRVRSLKFETSLEDATAQEEHILAPINEVEISSEFKDDMNAEVEYPV